MEKPREESLILEDLAALAASPGYAHAVARISHRDNVIHIQGNLKPSDMDRLFSRERLIQLELTTIIGLMAKRPLDLSLQQPDVLEGYVKRTDTLMHELHQAMSYPMFAAMFEAMKGGTDLPDPWRGPGMREPIFYGTESAYAFQYRDPFVIGAVLLGQKAMKRDLIGCELKGGQPTLRRGFGRSRL